MRRVAVLPVLLVSALLTPVVLAATASGAPPEVVRRAGTDRYATAVAISQASASPGVATAYVASGTAFADALAAAPVAGAAKAPILLVPSSTVPDVVRTELQRLHPGQIVVLGGPAAVSDAVVTQLEGLSNAPVERIAGDDRYATAAALSEATFPVGVGTAYVTSGESAPDALSAGAAAVGHGPVLLVTRDAVPGPIASELRRLEPGRIVVVGGKAAVSDALVAQLQGFTGGGVTRLAGVDRFETSAATSAGTFSAPIGDLYLASGRSFPDALAGAWAAGGAGSPVLLSERDCVPASVLQEIDRLQPARLVLLGGTAVVSDAVGRLAPCATPPTQTTVIATGLVVPWDVAFVDGGRAYINERMSGRVLLRAADGSITTAQTFAVDNTGEGGLLGLAASPTHATDGFLYAYMTTATDNRIVRFTPGGAVTPLVTGIAKNSIHNAGRVAFGPDGMLYAGTGDAGNMSAAQDPTSKNGKILRIRPDGGVPADNPVAGSYVYALGLRDPQGLAWDGAGRMYASEFGPDRDDEVNRIVAGGNYGWPTVTGQAHDPRFVDPIVVRQPPVASWSGAAIVHGGVPEWDGDLLVAALRGTRLYRFDLALDGSVVGSGEELYTGVYGRLRQVKQAPDGSLWLLTSNRDGRGSPVPADDRIIRIGR